MLDKLLFIITIPSSDMLNGFLSFLLYLKTILRKSVNKKKFQKKSYDKLHKNRAFVLR